MMSQNTTHTVNINNGLYQQIKKVKTQKNYKDDIQATEEIIRAGLEYLKEQAEDEYLLALALERKKNDNGVRISWKEHLAKHGITQEEFDAMEDVELEYELPD